MTEPMQTLERHATEAKDWHDYGHNLAAEAYYMGEQFADARRLLLCAWEGWTSGEPGPHEVMHEMLSTWWAMAMSSGISGIEKALEELFDAVQRQVDNAA